MQAIFSSNLKCGYAEVQDAGKQGFR